MLRLTSLQLFSKRVSPFRKAPSSLTAGRLGIIQNFHKGSINQSDELIIGGLVVLTGAVAGRYALKMFDSVSEQVTKGTVQDDAPAADQASTDANTKKTDRSNKKKSASASNNFGDWNTWFARNFYDGGFEEKMTKREAALILGVRESASADRIKDAHRRIMQKNHPDKGGSAYVTAKVNEAKDLLIKGK
mmetsp:Transcript_29654/g.49608  ORF Transcript_29654/g.49608 Transcript_29654/m.49608 type:complete len:190 (+) Transcript_29654:88-657(+)